jgi:ATP-binding cassette subfamily B protein
MNKENQNPLIYLFRKNWQYSEGNRGKIVLFWGMFIVSSAINLFVPPLIFAKMMDVIANEGITKTSIVFLLTLLGFVLLRSVLFWGLHGPARVIERTNAFKARINYRKYLLRGVLTMPLEWHNEHHSGDTIDKVEKGANGLYAFSEDSYESIYALVQLIGSYIILVCYSHSAAYIVLLMLLVSVWITMRFDRILIPQYKELNRAENNIIESIYDAISNVNTVIILRVERLVFGAIIHKLEKPFGLFEKNARISECKWFLTSICCNFMIAVVLGVFFWQNIGAAQGALVGSTYILINYLDQISELFFKFAGSYSDVIQRRAKIGNAEELSHDFKAENFTNHVLPKEWKKLEVKNLSFSYHIGEGVDLHLDNVAFTIIRGERVALVGETGSGKTTFLKIIRDLYHPKRLTLLLDGQVVPQGFEAISRAITLVQQKPELFARTILENITMGAEYDLDFVLKFTDMACFTSVVENLPKKFDSSIKEKGVNLSGGQQQRLALSRGLLACHDKDIVLLDEATSSLDVMTEIIVHQNIFREFSGKTIISTIHQLHLLPLFDRVCVFDKGEIIASGTIAELLTSCPKFVSLWEAMQQSSSKIAVA